MKKLSGLITVLLAAMFISGCIGVKTSLFPDSTEPLREFIISGVDNDAKVLVITINGPISDVSEERVLYSKPSMVQETVSQLRLAAKDKDIKALLLKVNSPGGTITASDVIYKEIMDFKKKTGAKVVVSMMDVAASGGYYISLPADVIMAHPTTVTGSVGVIFMRLRLDGLMEKIGVDITVDKSGRNKDMGSPFRKATDEEKKLFGDLIEQMASRFTGLVQKHRKLDEKAMDTVKTARVFMPEEAKKLGLIDEIGYLDDAVKKAKTIAKMPDDAQVIVYRRTYYPNDNLYNSTTCRSGDMKISLVDLGIFNKINSMKTGFYYLWMPEASK